MIIVLILLIAFIMYLTISKYNNVYSIVFVTSLISVATLIFATTMYINIKSIYTYMFYVEQFLFNSLIKFQIPIYDIKNLAFAALAVYILSMHLFIIKTGTTKLVRHNILFAVSVIIILIFNNSSLSEYIYIYCYTTNSHIIRNIVNQVYVYINYFNIFAIIYYTIMPYVMSHTLYKRTNSIYLKHRIVFLCMILALIQFMFLMIAFLCPINFCFTKFRVESIVNIEEISNENIYDTFFFIYTIVMILISLYVIVKFKIFDELFFKKHIVSKKTKFDFDDIKHIFHSCKNTVNIMEKLNTENIENIDNKDLIMKNMITEKECITYLFTHFSTFLSSLKKEPMSFESLYLSAVVKDALKISIPPSNVKVSITSDSGELNIYADKYSITEAIANVIQNAFEAIETDKSGYVQIKLWNEFGFSCVSIKDNGCGIERKNIKKLYRSLYTTKKTYNNWGMGLAYTKKIISLHRGFIDVLSKPGCGTEFQIIIPLD